MVMTVYTTLLQVILPLMIPVLVGALLARYRQLDTKPLLVLYLYFLSPAILLDTLLTAEITLDDVYKTLGFSLLNLILLWALATGLGRMLRLPQQEQAGLTLVSTFTNSVNYGLPLVLLAFGQLGLDKASVYVIGQMVIVNTIGIYFAARSHFSVKKAVRSVFALPAIYAAIFAFAVRSTGLQLPSGLESGIAMAAAAYSPVVMVVLGVQMMNVSKVKLDPEVVKGFWAGMSARLLLSPFAALLALYILRIDGVLFSVLFILSCMPVAVNSVILAEQFKAAPTMVAKCILWSTLISFLLLPVLISLVQ
ncbi:AEC family transporter [Paenibacillus sp. 1P07SE]|uniref:AEC family transporter n=1 Tax=Paenibacillus sp. 1P07SE TaxID=3132209 RepID=UPI0039A570E1